ncbi:MAG TPA: EAL domain-containing protein [Mycobacteriales bacterium]|nr:EAL domain-containing protein [Mycobacteriales bacterium]
MSRGAKTGGVVSGAAKPSGVVSNAAKTAGAKAGGAKTGGVVSGAVKTGAVKTGSAKGARPRWALPPAPPDTWPGPSLGAAALLAVLVAAGVPLLAVDMPLSSTEATFCAFAALAGVGSILAAYSLGVDAAITGRKRLRALAAVYVAVAILIAFRTALPDNGSGATRLSLSLLQVALGIGLLALSWRIPRTRRVVLLAAAAGVFVAGALRIGAAPYGFAWWLALELEVLVLAGAGLRLGYDTLTGFRRQSRHWLRLEAQVRVLQTTTTLMPGRAVTPDSDHGLPTEEEVQHVIDHGRLRIALQPVVHIQTGRVVGQEALSRFGGRLPTDRWFRAASHFGQGAALERAALTAALALLPTLDSEQFLAVNVSPLVLSDPEALTLLRGADLDRIVIEITEHEAVADYRAARLVLGELGRKGARIAVDDTGAGFASLRHVLMLQPDLVKLDLSLTRHIESDVRQQNLVRALTHFAAEVGTVLLAEGVESQEQLDALREIGVTLGQGWHLGVPAFAD